MNSDGRVEDIKLLLFLGVMMRLWFLYKNPNRVPSF